MSSKLDDVTDALVTAFTGLSGLASVLISDGPIVGDPSFADALLIGDDGDPESQAMSVAEQSWTDLACTRRREDGEIICAAVSQSGDTNMQTRRDRVMALIGACEDALRADLSLGGVVQAVQLVRASVQPYQNANGSAVVAPFVVAYWALV